MAQKTCPSCKNKCGPRQKKCPQCKFEFIPKDETEDEDNDEENEDDDPERNCIICKVPFEPRMIKKSTTGEAKIVWRYDDYCSVLCLEKAESVFFDFIYKLKTTDSHLLPDEIKNLVTEESFNRRKNDIININYASFMRLISPRKPAKTPEEYEEQSGRKPPKKNFEPIERPLEESDPVPDTDLKDLSLDDFLDAVVDGPVSPLLEKKPSITTPIQPLTSTQSTQSTSETPQLDRFHKQCPTCKHVMGKKTYVCGKCGHNFKSA